MMNIPKTFGLIKTMDLEKDFGAAKESQEPRGAILDNGYITYKNKGNTLLGVGEGNGTDYSGGNGSVMDYSRNHSEDTLLVQNKQGLRGARSVILTDKEDNIRFGGTGWKETRNFTDTTTGNKGNLYEDGNGNQFLVVGDAKVDVQG